MAKAKTSPIADLWPAEGRPIDEVMPALWKDYEQAARTHDFADLWRAWLNERRGRGKLYLKAGDECRLNALISLIAELRRRLEEGGLELRGRRGSPTTAQPERIPPSALQSLRINLDRTAEGEGLKLFDLRLHQVGPQTTGKSTATVTAVEAAAGRLKAKGKIPADVKITRFAQSLAEEMQKDKSVKPVGCGHIRNHLIEWGLWPVSNIK